jgi:hypothetical protein
MPSATWSLSVSDSSPKPPDRNLFNQAASALRAPAYCSGLRQPSPKAEGVGLPKDINGLLPPPSDRGAMGISTYDGRADVAASKDWCELFKDPSYRGHSFLDLLNSKDKPLQPSTRKGGPWLSESRVGPSTFSRLCRCITGHAPLGAYCQRFNISGPVHCSCCVGHGILETRSHALHSCPRWKHPGLHSLLDTVPTLTKFVQTNAAFCAIVRPRLAWNPG